MTSVKNDDAVFSFGSTAASVKGLSASVDIEAVGSNREGKPEILYGHFVSQDNHIYQVIVADPERPFYVTMPTPSSLTSDSIKHRQGPSSIIIVITSWLLLERCCQCYNQR